MNENNKYIVYGIIFGGALWYYSIGKLMIEQKNKRDKN